MSSLSGGYNSTQFCTRCGAARDANAKFCSNCGSPQPVEIEDAPVANASRVPNAELSLILNDIELGSIDRKAEVVGRLRLIPGLDLVTVRPVLDRTLDLAPRGSLLRFYAAATLAAFGDKRDVVFHALEPYLEAKPFENRAEGCIKIPWLVDKPGVGIGEVQPRLGVLEAFGYMRGNTQAAQALDGILEQTPSDNWINKMWREWVIYAAGANGNPLLRKRLEYMRARAEDPSESTAATVALDNFGTSTFLEIARLHSVMKNTPKSGCFIASASCADIAAPEVLILQSFRDSVLVHSGIGRGFIAAYYRLSPPLARLISQSESLQVIVRKVLITPIAWTCKKLISRERISEPEP